MATVRSRGTAWIGSTPPIGTCGAAQGLSLEARHGTSRHCRSVATRLENPHFFVSGEVDQGQRTRSFFVLDFARTRGPRLEDRRPRKGTEGSNPSLSANLFAARIDRPRAAAEYELEYHRLNEAQAMAA